jgi:hypothetical protein
MSATTMTPTRTARHAAATWQQGHRRRLLAASAERTADAAIAAGGLLVANGTLSLQLGLPAGATGISLGAGLVCAGLAWMSRHRAHRATPPHEGATAMRTPAIGTIPTSGATVTPIWSRRAA